MPTLHRIHQIIKKDLVKKNDNKNGVFFAEKKISRKILIEKPDIQQKSIIAILSKTSPNDLHERDKYSFFSYASASLR